MVFGSAHDASTLAGPDSPQTGRSRESLAEYKCPKKIYLVKSIPTTATGKIRRGAVAAALMNDQR